MVLGAPQSRHPLSSDPGVGGSETRGGESCPPHSYPSPHSASLAAAHFESQVWAAPLRVSGGPRDVRQGLVSR